MNERIKKELSLLEHQWKHQQVMLAENKDQVPMDERILAIGPDAGAFIRDLCLRTTAHRILEVGTSHGYSTLWLADAALETKGHITTIEKRASKKEKALAHFASAGVTEIITLLEEDARTAIDSLSDQRFDFALLDARKDQYITYAKKIIPLLRIGGIIVADNIIEPPQTKAIMDQFVEEMRNDARLTVEINKIGSGLAVLCKVSD